MLEMVQKRQEEWTGIVEGMESESLPEECVKVCGEKKARRKTLVTMIGQF